MKQAPLEKINPNRQWSVSKPWNLQSLAAEAIARKKAPETTVSVSAEVPLQFVNGMVRHGLLSQSQADRKDEQAIAEALLATMENRLYGRITARRYA